MLVMERPQPADESCDAVRAKLGARPEALPDATLKQMMAKSRQEVGRQQFAENAAEALYCKMAAVTSAKDAQRLNAFLATSPRDFAAFTETLTTAPVYFWEADIARAVQAAAVSYPLPRTMTLTLPAGFATFNAPVLSYGPTPRLTVDRGEMSALAWRQIDNVRGMSWLMLYTLDWNGAGVHPFDKVVWPPEALTPEERIGYDAETLAYTEQLARFVFAASAFVQQRLAAPEPLPIARHVAKQAARVSIDSTVKTIVLRARDRAHEIGTGDSAARAYSCRWIVRGHWRQQFYASRGEHAARWIAPHLKGPDDRPLRTPKPEVFAVVR